MFSKAALETINFQHQSPLAKQLIALIQEMMDELDKTALQNPKYLSDSRLKGRVEKVTKYLTNNLSLKIEKLLREELNLNIKLTMLSDIVILNGACFVEYFEQDAKNEDNSSFGLGLDFMSGLIPTDKENTKFYDIEFFKKQASDIDLTTGKLKSLSKDFVMHLLMYSSMFISKEVIDPNNLPPITAPEIASVILHEIGHALSFVEHCADMYYRTDIVQNTITYTNDLTDDKTIEDVVNKVEKETTDKTSTGILVGLKSLKNLSIFTPILALLEIFLYIPLLIGATLTRFPIDAVYSVLNSSKIKTSDIVVTRNNASYSERVADEFVSRHGLAKEEVSAFVKINIFYDQGHQNMTIGEVADKFGTLSSICYSIKLLKTCFLYPLITLDTHTYDPLIMRLEQLVKDCYVAFKDDSLIHENREYYIDQVKSMEKFIDELKNSTSMKIKQYIFGVMSGIIHRTSALDAISTANLSADYDKLQQMTSGLIKNKLYYHAARLKSILFR